MANLIKQKYLEGIDSSKFKIEQGGSIKAENSSGTLVDVFKFDTAQNIVKIYNDKQVADTDFVNDLITQEISDRNSAISQAISDLINGAPAALDTLKEISDALAEDQTALDGLLQDLTTYVKLDGSRAFSGNIDAGSFKVVNLANGMMSTEAVNKGQLDSGVQEAKDYTDNLEDRALLLNGSQSMTGALQMNSYKIEGLANGMMSTEAVNKGQLDSGIQESKDYTDNLEDRALLLNGSQSMTGALQMNSYKIEGLANGMMSTEAVNKGQLDSGVQEAKDYTDNLEDRALLLNGSQSMTGALQMNSYKIEGLANGMMATEAVNKGQLDSVEQGLQSQITTEKERVDAILLASDADKDSFAEIVTLINSVDTSNSDSLAGHLTATVDAHDASAISVVPAGNLAAVQVQGALEELQVHIDTVEQSVTNLDAYAQEVRSDLDQEIIDRAAAVSAEEARAMAAESDLHSAVDIEEFNRIAAVSAEAQARSDEDATFFKLDGSRAITGDVQMGAHSILDVFKVESTFINEIAGDFTIEEARFSKLEHNLISTGFVSPEVLDGDGNIYSVANTQKSEMTPYEVQVSSLPEGDKQWVSKINSYSFSLNEMQPSNENGRLYVGATGPSETDMWVTVSASNNFHVGNDLGALNLYSSSGKHINITSDAFIKLNSETKAYKELSLLDPSDDTLPAVPTSPEHAVNKAYVDSQISANKDFAKETFEIDVTAELSYVELAQAPVANSLVVFVNRLAVHEGVDYTVSEVDGVTRLTWAGEFAVGGIEAIELGDFIRVTYMF